MLNAVLALSLLVRVALVAPEDTLDSVEKQLTDKAHKATSVRAKVKTVTDTSNPAMSFKSTMEGTYEMVFNGKRGSMRSETTSVTTTKMGDQETKMEAKSVMVTKDGKGITLTEQDGQKMAMKLPGSPEPVPTGSMFEEMKKSYDLKLAGEEKVIGRTCWVIEGTPKTQDGMTGNSKYWYDQDSGFMLKMESMTADGKPMSSTTYTDVEFGVKIDDSRFSLDIPEGYQVMDLGAGG